MPTRIDLNAETREETGHHAKQVRRSGRVPAVLYGHGFKNVVLSLDGKEFQHILAHAGRTSLISLHVDGKRGRSVFIKKVQRHPVSRDILHVDLFAVRMDEKMRAEVPIHLVGAAPATRQADMMLLHGASVVRVECLPTDLPHAINVDVGGLTDVDQTIYASDLRIPEGVTLLDDPHEMIVKVQQTKREMPEPTEEAAATATDEERPTPAESGKDAGQGAGGGNR